MSRSLSDFEQRLADTLVLGASANGRLVGMVGLKRHTGQKDRYKAFVWGMYVTPDARRHGIGAALLDRLCREAAGIVEQLTLSVVKDNAAAIALYRRAGFETYGIEPCALKGPAGYADEVLMVRFLHSGLPPSNRSR